jgi:hypothetical protein
VRSRDMVEGVDQSMPGASLTTRHWRGHTPWKTLVLLLAQQEYNRSGAEKRFRHERSWIALGASVGRYSMLFVCPTRRRVVQYVVDVDTALVAG